MSSDFTAAAGRLLDQAVAEAFRLEKDRLAANRELNSWQLSQTLTSASAELDKVRDLHSPNYQDLAVSLVYLLRYHFSHVNLSWSMLATSNIDKQISSTANRKSLQIVDVGAGTFAMLFGAALFSAERVAEGGQPLRIDVASVEPALAMRTMGDAAWASFERLAFTEDLGKTSLLTPLRLALGHITHRHDPADLGSLAAEPSAHRCLTAMHAIYRDSDQRLALRSELEILYQGLSPHSGFLTCYVAHRDQAIVLSPFDRRRLDLQPQPKMEAEPVHTRRAGHRAGVKREGRYATPPQLSYATWSKSLDDTSVLYWIHDE